MESDGDGLPGFCRIFEKEVNIFAEVIHEFQPFSRYWNLSKHKKTDIFHQFYQLRLSLDFACSST